MKNVQKFLEKHFLHEEGRTLHYHKGAFYEWSGTHYPQMDESGLRAMLYEFLSKARCWVKRGGEDELEDFKPTRKTVDDALDALKAKAHIDASRSAPRWIDGENEIISGDIIACKNGLVHLPTKRLIPHSPRFFTHNALPFDYLPDSGSSRLWNRFLDDLWGDDKEAQDALQEIFGYLISGKTKLHKIPLIVGPKRSGKGTIGRVLTGLLGQENICAPTLAGLQMQFGLATLIGKMVAIISDARLGGRADQHVIAERLLTISGEDTTTIHRKYLPDWNGHLSARFVILTNELPRIADSSGALASRFIVLTLKNSFFGKEDHDLTEKLLGELPQILNWAIDGLARLKQRGNFLQPSSSQDSIQELEDLTSPISAFVRDCIDIGPEFEVERSISYKGWQIWCAEQGREHAGTEATFGRDLRAFLPGIGTRHLTVNGKRKRFYTGFKLKEEFSKLIKISNFDFDP
jgi:putative DNA primase/helicase